MTQFPTYLSPTTGGATPWEGFSSFTHWPPIVNPEDQIPYLPGCMECMMRESGESHIHDVFAYGLEGQVHRCWFDYPIIRAFDVNSRSYNYRSWSQWFRPGEDGEPGQEFMRLTIEATPTTDERIHVWKLTDTYDDYDRRLGLWPD